MADLEGKTIAVLVTSGVEEVELTKPVAFLCDAGAEVIILTPKQDEVVNVIRSLNGVYPGDNIYADALMSDIDPGQFDALFIPGGLSPDHLRMTPDAVDFVKAFKDKPIFAICHGPQMLVSADLVKGKKITSWPSLEIDMKNAGAHWVNEEVVVDGNLVTSRMPADIPMFCDTIFDVLSSWSGKGREKAA